MIAALLEWARPGWAWSLLVPLGWLVLARFGVKPRVRASATTRLWRELASETGHGTVSMRLWRSPVLWLVASALTLAALALAGPRRAQAEAPVTWHVVCDPSPSTAVPFLAGDSESVRGEPTRIRRAAASAANLLQELWRPGDRALWSWGGAEPVLVEGPELPREAFWLAERAPFDGWGAFDRGDCLWVTDRSPSPAPQRAGLAASGGAAVPGAVAWKAGARLDWDGANYVEVPDAAPAGRVAVMGLPRPLLELSKVWAAARGLTVDAADATDDSQPAPLLTIASVSVGAEEVEAVIGRDGWSGRARGAPSDTGPGSAWLTTLDGVWVSCAPGRIELMLSSLDALEGDPAAFAVSWSELFDSALRAPADVFARLDRESAGEPHLQRPAHDRSRGEGPPAAASTDSWLALGAGLAAVLAVLAGGVRARG